VRGAALPSLPWPPEPPPRAPRGCPQALRPASPGECGKDCESRVCMPRQHSPYTQHHSTLTLSPYYKNSKRRSSTAPTEPRLELIIHAQKFLAAGRRGEQERAGRAAGRGARPALEGDDPSPELEARLRKPWLMPSTSALSTYTGGPQGASFFPHVDAHHVVHLPNLQRTMSPQQPMSEHITCTTTDFRRIKPTTADLSIRAVQCRETAENQQPPSLTQYEPQQRQNTEGEGRAWACQGRPG